MIVVQSKDCQVNLVFTCWPSPQLDCSQIALNSYYMNINGMSQRANPNLYWKKIEKSLIKTAKSISIEFQSHLSRFLELNINDEDENLKQDLDLIISILKEKNLNKVVLLNQNIFVSFLGQKMAFKIISIRAQSNKSENKNKKDTNVDLIANKMDKRLNLLETNEKQERLNQFKEIISEDLNFYKIDSKTKIDLVKTKLELKKEPISQNILGFDDIGGLEKEIEQLKEFFISPFENRELYKRIGKFEPFIFT
jgi:ATP-dependent 26S proteasome regulatory subunit